MYRIVPSVSDVGRVPVEKDPVHVVSEFSHCEAHPNQMRWRPFEVENGAGMDFIQGMRTICGAGR